MNRELRELLRDQASWERPPVQQDGVEAARDVPVSSEVRVATEAPPVLQLDSETVEEEFFDCSSGYTSTMSDLGLGREDGPAGAESKAAEVSGVSGARRVGAPEVSRPTLEPHGRPRLDHLRDTEIREFLHAEAEYQHWLASSGYRRYPLRSLMGPSLLHVLEDFMVENGALIPENRDQRAKDRASEDVTEWDAQLRIALKAASLSRATQREVSIKEAERIVRKYVKWDIAQETFSNAFWGFRTLWQQTLADHGLKEMFQDGGESGKRTALLLVSLVQPEAFRAMVESDVKRDSVTTQAAFFATVRELHKVYVGIMLQR